MHPYAQWRIRLQDFFESRFMHWTVGLLTVINTLALGIETTPSLRHATETELEYLHLIILWTFAIEIGFRIIAFGRSYFKGAWNIFDFIVVVLSFLPISEGISALRSLRLLHLFAVVEDMPKTRHILMGFYHSLPGILNVVFLMLLLYFIFSVMGVYFFQHHLVPGFDSLGGAMHTMFQVLTGDDWYNVLNKVSAIYPYAWVYFYFYYILMVFIVLNLFIGVVVGALQAAEEEVYRKAEEDNVASKLDTIYREINALKQSLDNKQAKDKS